MSEPTNDMIPVPINWQEDDPISLQVTLSEKLAKQKARQQIALAEAQAFKQLGSAVIKVKAKTHAALGKYADKIGIKSIGLGRILLAGDNADSAFAELDDIIRQLMTSDPPTPPDVIASFVQLKRDFNRQLMESGEAYIRADKSPSEDNKGNSLSLPFPAGSQLAVAIGPSKPKEVKQIDDGS